jgi:tRNA-dihydrouridine synthase
MGCPFPRVANKKRGSGLLPYPDKVEAMLEGVFEHIGDMKFSVKCRLGYFSPDEIDAIIPIFNKFPSSELIIHPRIGKQLYKGEADVERFKALIPYINAPLVYNGDIFSVDDFGRIREAVQPVNEFMLGRGILANPFLAEDICRDASNASERTERLHAYVLDLYDDRLRHAGGSPKVLGRMKELWSYLMYSFDEPQDIWRKIKKINALKDYEEAVEIVFQSHTLQ